MMLDTPGSHGRLRVVVFGPGPEAHGGIARFTGILLSVDEPSVTIEVVRTYAQSLPGRIRRYASALAFALRLRDDGATVAHINVSAGGSTVRKALIAAILKRRRVPFVLHLHASSYPAFFGRLAGRRRAAVVRLFDRADRVVVLGEASSRFVVGEIGVERDRVTVVANGVPGPGEVPTRDTAGGEVSILFAGELSERKGVPVLIDALASIPPGTRWRAVLAGGGDLESVGAAIRAAGLADRVELPGWISPADLQSRLAGSDMFVLPSLNEGLPLALLEAMANGCAVVTTPVGNITDLVVDGVNGLLVPAGDSVALAAALSSVMADPGRRSSLGGEARRTWVDGYSDRAMTDSLLTVWQAVAREAR